MGNGFLTSGKRRINDGSSKKQTYNVTRDNDDAVLNTSKAVGFPKSVDGIIPEDDRESDEERKKYAGEHDAVRNKRGTNNNNKITSNTKSIGKNKIQKDRIKKKINKRKITRETILSNGNVWKKDGKRKIERLKDQTKAKYHLPEFLRENEKSNIQECSTLSNTVARTSEDVDLPHKRYYRK